MTKSIRTRFLDAMLVANLCVDAWLGFHSVGTYRVFELQTAILLGQGTLVCVIGGVYPFRLAGRVLWLVTAPVFVFLFMLLGIEVLVRWASTPAVYPNQSAIAAGFVAVIGWYIPLLFWLFRAREGWTMKQYDRFGDPLESSRVLSLRDLLAITGIAAVLLVLARQILPKELLEESGRYLLIALRGWPALVTHTAMATIAAWMILRSPRRTVVICIVWILLGSTFDVLAAVYGYAPQLLATPLNLQYPSTGSSTVLPVVRFTLRALFQVGAMCAYVATSLTLFRVAGWRLEKSSSSIPSDAAAK